MERIRTSELEEMIKKNFLEKGLNEIDINEEDVKNISEKIKNEVNQNVKPKSEEPISVDISTNEEEVEEVPNENPEAVVSSSGLEKAEEDIKKEGELDERERALAQKEEELRAKEEELAAKEEELEYKPEIPKALEEMDSEKLFVFDMSKLSAGAENLSKLPMKFMDDPEKETTIKDLWLEKAKKKSEVYVVKFEKVGEVEFDPIEGTSNLTTIKDVNGDKELTDFQNGIDPDGEESVPTNMTDTIEPVTDVTQPMTDDMGLNVSDSITVENDDNLRSTIEELVKKYLHNEVNNA